MTWGEWVWFGQWEAVTLNTRTIEMQITTRPTGWELIQNKRQFALEHCTNLCRDWQWKVDGYNFGTGDGEILLLEKAVSGRSFGLLLKHKYAYGSPRDLNMQILFGRSGVGPETLFLTGSQVTLMLPF